MTILVRQWFLKQVGRIVARCWIGGARDTAVGRVLRLMRKCFGEVLMIEEISLCLLRIIFSIAWVLTGRHLDGCPVFALSASFLSFVYHCAHAGSPSSEVMLSGHYSMIGTDACLFSEERRTGEEQSQR